MTLKQTMPVIFIYLSTAMIGAILGGLVGFFVGCAYIKFMNVPQREGTAGYMVVLFFASLGAVLGIAATLIAMAIWRSPS
jgi:membrane protein YqaA with SNARE-associated domain